MFKSQIEFDKILFGGTLENYLAFGNCQQCRWTAAACLKNILSLFSNFQLKYVSSKYLFWSHQFQEFVKIDWTPTMYSIHFFPQALATPTLTVIYAWVHIWITITIFRQRFFAIWFLCICCRLGVFNTKLSWEAVLTILFQWGSGGHKVFILDQILEEWPWGSPLGV